VLIFEEATPSQDPGGTRAQRFPDITDTP